MSELSSAFIQYGYITLPHSRHSGHTTPPHTLAAHTSTTSARIRTLIFGHT